MLEAMAGQARRRLFREHQQLMPVAGEVEAIRLDAGPEVLVVLAAAALDQQLEMQRQQLTIPGVVAAAQVLLQGTAGQAVQVL